MSDLISRNDVLKMLVRVEKMHPYKVTGDWDSYLPYPEAWSECVSMIESYLKQIPSAEPERKKGKWGQWGECPYCSYLRQFPDDKFCSNCGADMRGDENE